MTRILIQNGHVVDPANNVDQLADVYIDQGKIVAIGKKPDGFVADTTIDAENLIVSPGFVDLSTSLREPGYEYKANIESETAAAAKAGVTTLCCLPETSPVIDTPAVVEYVQQRARQAGYARVLVIGALTKNLKGQQLSEMAALKEAGCVAVSNGYYPIADTLVMRRALEYAGSHDITVFLRAEDSWLSRSACAHEGAVSTRLGLSGVPDVAETIAVWRDLSLVEFCGTRVHFSCLSTDRAVRMVARAQHDGLPVSANVSAHQLHLIDIDVAGFNCNYHVRPPLRGQRDKDGLRRGLREGVLAGICSDHQPHDVDAKIGPFAESAPGMSTLETLLPLTLKLVEEQCLSLSEAVASLSCKPAQVIGIDAGTLSIGGLADIAIFDPSSDWMVNDASLFSRGKNSPYMDRALLGQVKYTLLEGRIVYQNALVGQVQ